MKAEETGLEMLGRWPETWSAEYSTAEYSQSYGSSSTDVRAGP